MPFPPFPPTLPPSGFPPAGGVGGMSTPPPLSDLQTRQHALLQAQLFAQLQAQQVCAVRGPKQRRVPAWGGVRVCAVAHACTCVICVIHEQLKSGTEKDEREGGGAREFVCPCLNACVLLRQGWGCWAPAAWRTCLEYWRASWIKSAESAAPMQAWLCRWLQTFGQAPLAVGLLLPYASAGWGLLPLPLAGSAHGVGWPMKCGYAGTCVCAQAHVYARVQNDACAHTYWCMGTQACGGVRKRVSTHVC